MSDRSTIFETVQIGVETTPGTPVPANKKLPSMMFEIGPEVDISKYRGAGYKFPAITTLNKEWTSMRLSGPLTFEELVFPLSSVLSYAAPVLQDATSYLWTLTMDSDGPDTQKTYTVEQGSSIRAHEVAYTLFTGAEMTFSRAGNELSGDAIGNALDDNITMTATPTELPLVPILPTYIDIKLADTQAGLTAASPLTRAIQASWSIGDRNNPIFPLATAAGTGYAGTVEVEPSAQAKLLLAADATGMGLLTTMRNGSSKFMRIQATGPNIDSEDYYFQTDLALQVEDVSEFRDEDGLVAIEWTFAIIHDVTWGKALEVQIINTQTGL